MIERKFVARNVKEYAIQEFISETLKNVGHSHTEVVRTPLGERIIIYASRPGLVVGRKGENIKKLTSVLKKKFGLENPQIEISEVLSPDLDAQIVAERIASTMERFGLQRFKAIGHKMLEDVMRAGARGIEICISGKVPSARARTWRFYKGYLKKSGEIAITGVRKAIANANLKSGTVGIRVRILTQDVRLPDDVDVVNAQEPQTSAPEATTEVAPQSTDEGAEGKKPKRKAASPRKPARKRPKKNPEGASEASPSPTQQEAAHESKAA